VEDDLDGDSNEDDEDMDHEGSEDEENDETNS
jgi:hypothetical protein